MTENTRRVLLVEGDSHLAESLGIYLCNEGCAVERTADSHLGVSRIERLG